MGEYNPELLLPTERIIDLLGQRALYALEAEKSQNKRLGEPGYVAPAGSFFKRDTTEVPGMNLLKFRHRLPDSFEDLPDERQDHDSKTEAILSMTCWLPILKGFSESVEILTEFSNFYLVRVKRLAHDLSLTTNRYVVTRRGVYELKEGAAAEDVEALLHFDEAAVDSLYDPEHQNMAASWVEFLSSSNLVPIGDRDLDPAA